MVNSIYPLCILPYVGIPIQLNTHPSLVFSEFSDYYLYLYYYFVNFKYFKLFLDFILTFSLKCDKINITKEEKTSKTGGQSNEINISITDNSIEREVIQ